MRSDINMKDNYEDNYLLVAYADNTRNLSHLLKAIHFKEVATICCTADGMKVTVEDAKCIQGIVYIQAALFHDYILKNESLTFKINLGVLLECLNIFGSNNNPSSVTSVKICYSGYGSPLVLLLEENGVLTDCKLNTLESEDILDFEFTPSKVINKIIMKSDALKEIWMDLDMNCEVLQIIMSPDDPYFQLSTKGVFGAIHVNFSKMSDMIESFECTQKQKNRYQIFLIKTCTKALMQSSKISIRTDERGFLCLQYMIKMEGINVCFIEYICAPTEFAEDDDP